MLSIAVELLLSMSVIIDKLRKYSHSFSFISVLFGRIRKKVKMNPSLPIVVVIGATGTGKSKLAIEIAKKFNGEVISADSMQIYKHLNIITNKVTKEECMGVPHHLISFLDPDVNFTVVEFRNKVLPLIDKLLNANKIPVITGGTNYYIESIIWKVLVSQSHSLKRSNTSDETFVPSKSLKTDPDVMDYNDWFHLPLDDEQVKHLCNADLHKKLYEVDKASAEILHPNNRRKVQRALQVFLQENVPLSTLIANQRSVEGGSCLGGPLRYTNIVMLWLQCDREILNERLDERVDKMMKDGLIGELLEFHKLYNESRIKNNESTDYTRGIFQSIGFKEFHEFLMLPVDEHTELTGESLINKGVSDLKLVTKRYARNQEKWIKNRFLKETGRQVPEIYALNVSDVSIWDSTVRDPAFQVVDSYVKNKKCPLMPLSRTVAPKDVQKLFHCRECDRFMSSQLQWEIHLKSKKHRKMLQALKKNDNTSCEVKK